MNEKYLWDRSGDADPEIVRLEQVLGQFRWSKMQAQDIAAAKPRKRRPSWSAAAAAVLIAAAGATLLLREKPVVPTSWQLSLAGGKGSAVRGGAVIETGAEHGTMSSEFVGEISLDPHSRLQLIEAHDGLQQFALERGTIHAFIWAPPATFVVDTPTATTVDLGCRYTLNVARDGSGFLTVEMGWVAFEWRGVESFIPAGAVCSTRPGHGPGTPYFQDAPKALSGPLAEFDRNGSVVALQLALNAARSNDALTLWHLMQRTRGSEREHVFDRYAALVKLPPGVTREAILSGDRKATDAAWNVLDLGDMTWWRNWKRKW